MASTVVYHGYLCDAATPVNAANLAVVLCGGFRWFDRRDFSGTSPFITDSKPILRARHSPSHDDTYRRCRLR